MAEWEQSDSTKAGARGSRNVAQVATATTTGSAGDGPSAGQQPPPPRTLVVVATERGKRGRDGTDASGDVAFAVTTTTGSDGATAGGDLQILTNAMVVKVAKNPLWVKTKDPEHLGGKGELPLEKQPYHMVPAVIKAWMTFMHHWRWGNRNDKECGLPVALISGEGSFGRKLAVRTNESALDASSLKFPGWKEGATGDFAGFYRLLPVELFGPWDDDVISKILSSRLRIGPSIHPGYTVLANFSGALIEHEHPDAVACFCKLFPTLLKCSLRLLSKACRESSDWMVAHLLLLGALVDGGFPRDQTSHLQAAVQRGDTLMVKSLLKAGANRDHENLDGRTAKGDARRKGNKEILALLGAEAIDDGQDPWENEDEEEEEEDEEEDWDEEEEEDEVK